MIDERSTKRLRSLARGLARQVADDPWIGYGNCSNRSYAERIEDALKEAWEAGYAAAQAPTESPKDADSCPL